MRRTPVQFVLFEGLHWWLFEVTEQATAVFRLPGALLAVITECIGAVLRFNLEAAST